MRKSREEPAIWWRILRPIVWGVIVGAVVGLVFLLASAAVMASMQVPTGVVLPLALAIVSIAALAGGFGAARCARERGLLYGAGCGLVLFLIVTLAGFGMEQTAPGASLLLKAALSVGFGALGGVLGVNSKQRVHAHR